MNHYKITREVFHHSTNFYLIATDTNGFYQYINPAYQTAFAHVSGNLVGEPYHTTMHADDIVNVTAAAARCFAEPDKSFPATIRKHNGQGGYIVTQWDFRMIKDEAGEFAGFFCVGYDLTEFENEKHKNKQLNNLLQDTKSSLEHKSDLLEELIFDQSHLLRSPLSNILGIISILKKMDTDENVTSLVKMLESSSMNLDNVVCSIVKKSYH
jgi:PAS domain S-box-containing protein